MCIQALEKIVYVSVRGPLKLDSSKEMKNDTIPSPQEYRWALMDTVIDMTKADLRYNVNHF